jgi:hypothetical protein
MLKQSTHVIPQPQPQQSTEEDTSLAESVGADVLGNLVGIPGLGGILDVIESQDNSGAQSSQTVNGLSVGGIADLQKHALAQHMGSFAPSVSLDSEKEKDRAKAKKHPNYIDPALFLHPRAKPVKE